MVLAVSPRRLFVLGGVALVFGVLTLVWPMSTVVALVELWGVYALVDGVVMVALGARLRGPGRWLLVAAGVLSVLVGLVAVVHPFSGAAALTWVLGLWLAVRGVVQLVEAVGHRVAGPRWMTVVAGAAFLLAGVLVMANSGAAVLTISVWLGILAILWGALLVTAGFALRKVTRTPDTVA